MFSPAERKIFEYFDGRQTVKGDPVAVLRRFSFALDETPNRFLAAVQKEAAARDPVAAHEARERILAAVREVFEMAPFDRLTGEGSLEDDCWAALAAFTEWQEGNARPAAS